MTELLHSSWVWFPSVLPADYKLGRRNSLVWQDDATARLGHGQLGARGKVMERFSYHERARLCGSCKQRYPGIVRLHFTRSLRKRVVVNAFDPGERKSWLRNLLFQRIETWRPPDVDTGEAEDQFSSEQQFRDSGDMDDLEEELEFDTQEDVDYDEVDALIDDDAKFASWRRKTEAKNELRNFQATGRDPDSKDWEDWLDDSWGEYNNHLGGKDEWYESPSDWEKGGFPREAPIKAERGMKRTIKELFFRIFEREEEVDDDLEFEERVFRFTSRATAKFFCCLIVIPWFTDFLVHDFVMVPFLNTYVAKVPLAAKVLDIRESQKLRIIENLKLERQRVRLEADIGKAPPLSDDGLSEHLREEACSEPCGLVFDPKVDDLSTPLRVPFLCKILLREEMRLENREAFAHIWSDFVAGLTIFLLLIFNPKQVSIMKLTGERLFTNISDTGKAFIIILLTDIFLGYHSESGWETVSEMVLDHYGFEVSQAAIYTFVAIVPVTFDACFKLWVFRFFRTLSPSASATFREMQRH